jgi:hypothetical protein
MAEIDNCVAAVKSVSLLHHRSEHHQLSIIGPTLFSFFFFWSTDFVREG